MCFLRISVAINLPTVCLLPYVLKFFPNFYGSTHLLPQFRVSTVILVNAYNSQISRKDGALNTIIYGASVVRFCAVIFIFYF